MYNSGLDCVILSVLEFKREPFMSWISRSPIQLKIKLTMFTYLKMPLHKKKSFFPLPPENSLTAKLNLGLGK